MRAVSRIRFTSKYSHLIESRSRSVRRRGSTTPPSPRTSAHRTDPARRRRRVRRGRVRGCDDERDRRQGRDLPGSLYQFFANKDEVGRALAEAYAERLATLELLSGLTTENLETELDAALARIVGFNIEHPGFKALFARTDMPPSMRAAVAPAHDAIEKRVREAIAAIMPDAEDRRIQTMATVILSMVKGLMPLIVAEADPAHRRLLVAELHRGIVAYVSSARGSLA